METNQYTHKVNSKIEFKTQEEMMEFFQRLMAETFNLIEVEPKLIVAPKDPFPYQLNNTKSISRAMDLFQYFVNLTGEQLVQGFVEELEAIHIAAHSAKPDGLEKSFVGAMRRYNEFLKTLSENCAILQRELNLQK